jgi:hypothetical protein
MLELAATLEKSFKFSIMFILGASRWANAGDETVESSTIETDEQDKVSQMVRSHSWISTSIPRPGYAHLQGTLQLTGSAVGRGNKGRGGSEEERQDKKDTDHCCELICKIQSVVTGDEDNGNEL